MKRIKPDLQSIIYPDGHSRWGTHAELLAQCEGSAAVERYALALAELARLGTEVTRAVRRGDVGVVAAQHSIIFPPQLGVVMTSLPDDGDHDFEQDIRYDLKSGSFALENVGVELALVHYATDDPATLQVYRLTSGEATIAKELQACLDNISSPGDSL